MIQANLDIRQEIKAAGIFQWRVADAFGLNEQNFCKLLRKELPPQKKERILTIIDQLVREDSEGV